MPMRSQAQRSFLHARHPGIAARFEAETPKGAQLPRHVPKKGQLATMHDKMNGRKR